MGGFPVPVRHVFCFSTERLRSILSKGSRAVYTRRSVSVTSLIKQKDTIMNPQIHSQKNADIATTSYSAAPELDILARSGFTDEEITSLFWLRQWYQSGGSDRVEVIRHLEFVKLLVLNGKLEQ